MTGESLYLLVGVVVALSIVQYVWRMSVARGGARNWLRQHHYRVRNFRLSWFGSATFAGLYRNSDRAFSFIAEIDDTQLGGSGKVRLRVWTDWLGMIDRNVEVDWLSIPKGGGEAAPVMDRLADAQLAILQRVAGGETAFYAPRSSENSPIDFDMFIEHVFALANRGMLQHGSPVENLSSARTRYASIGSLSLTAQGRKWLESQLESPSWL